MASLKQIAADLGVSYTLVSKVLSGKLGTTGVSQKTREAILEKSRTLNYTPNRLAVALKAGRKGSIAVFLHGMGSPGSDVTDRLLGGLAEGLEKSGSRLLLRFFKTKEEFLAACDIQLRAEVDGLVVAGVNHPELLPKFLELERENVRVVSIFSDLPKRKSLKHTANAAVDYEMQGYLATKHLLDMGLRRIACLHTIDLRTKGYRRAFAEAKATIRQDYLINCESFHFEDGSRAAETIMAQAKPFEGVFCQSDAQAVGLINTLTKRGVKVPDEIKVTGIDNSPLAKGCIVPITSVTSEMRPAGMKAIDLLLRSIEGETVSSVWIPPRLEVRESTGG